MIIKKTRRLFGEIKFKIFSKFNAFLDNILYITDEYGQPELRIETTVFRFFIYPSYWHYLKNKYLTKIGLLQKSKHKYSNTYYLTSIIPHDAGIGHQLSCWNTALIFSLKNNLKFVHYPISESWEEFLNFGDGELNYFDLKNNKYFKIVNLPRIRNTDKRDTLGHHIFTEIINFERQNSSQNILFQIHSNHFAHDQTIIADILRAKYWKTRENDPINLDWRKDRLHIACHIRRGDILEANNISTNISSNFKARYLNDQYFIKVIERITNVLTMYNLDIHIFSQGHVDKFSNFDKLGNVVYHLDEDPRQSFHGMIIADILVLSPSSFSYKPGLISKGIKIGKYPWWHEIPNNSEWLRSNEFGEFNTYPLMERYGFNIDV